MQLKTCLKAEDTFLKENMEGSTLSGYLPVINLIQRKYFDGGF